MKSYGFNVRIKFKRNSPQGEIEETRNNVTEIHYGYNDLLGECTRVAFESDVHGTGGTIEIKHIKEFEARIAIKKEKEY